jgi:hypothetical protein
VPQVDRSLLAKPLVGRVPEILGHDPQRLIVVHRPRGGRARLLAPLPPGIARALAPPDQLAPIGGVDQNTANTTRRPAPLHVTPGLRARGALGIQLHGDRLEARPGGVQLEDPSDGGGLILDDRARDVRSPARRVEHGGVLVAEERPPRHVAALGAMPQHRRRPLGRFLDLGRHGQDAREHLIDRAIEA